MIIMFIMGSSYKIAKQHPMVPPLINIILVFKMILWYQCYLLQTNIIIIKVIVMIIKTYEYFNQRLQLIISMAFIMIN